MKCFFTLRTLSTSSNSRGLLKRSIFRNCFNDFKRKEMFMVCVYCVFELCDMRNSEKHLHRTFTDIFLKKRKKEKTILSYFWLELGFKNTKKNNDVKNVEDIVFEQNFICGWNKKGKDSLEIRVVLLMFSPEPEISRVTVQSVHQNGRMATFVRNFLVKITLRLF